MRYSVMLLVENRFLSVIIKKVAIKFVRGGIMQIYLKRQAYSQLLAWKNQPNHSTLEISGARQVGKTFLVNKFADEQYSNKIYVNLLDFSGELFLEKYEQLRNEIRNGFVCPNPVHEIVNENFVFWDLKERINHPSEIALETLAFATLGNGEIDFFVKTIESQKNIRCRSEIRKK